MENTLNTCIQQLERGAAFELITECEPFKPIYDSGSMDGSTIGLWIGVVVTVCAVGLIVAVVGRN